MANYLDKLPEDVTQIAVGAAAGAATLTETVTTTKARGPRRSHLPGQRPFGPLRIVAFVVLLLLTALLAPWLATHHPNAQTLSMALRPPSATLGGRAWSNKPAKGWATA